MKILVTAPAGRVGRRVLQELLAPEFSVRVIARDPARLPDEVREQVEVVRGSSGDAATLGQALDGVEALFWCIPTESAREVDVRGHYERFARAASRAIREAGTPRVVTISTAGKGLAHNAGPISGLHAMEETLNASGAAIRHLRCGMFMENFLQQARSIAGRGVFTFPMSGHVQIPMVAVADVADVALRRLVRRDWHGIADIPVHGPTDLSCSQAGAILEQILEQPVRHQEASANQYVQTLLSCGASVDYARGQAAMFTALAQGITGVERGTVESAATTFAAWAEQELLPRVKAIRREPGSPLTVCCHA